MAALGFAIQILDLLPLVVQGVTGAIDVFNKGTEAVKHMRDENRDPTEEEWKELNDATQALRNQLHQD